MDGGLENKEGAMKPFEKCPVCGETLETKKVEKSLKGNGNTAFLTVKAEVCPRCGERLYSPEVIAKFDDVREKLKKGEIENFVEIGKSYQVA
jgi:YgiT-type zinc finger domain-containing protein